MRALSNKGDVIGLEDPGYMPARHLAEMHGLSPKFLNIGNHGAADNQNLAEMQYSYPSHYTTDVTQLDQGHFSTSEGAIQSPVLKGRMSNISEEAGYNNY